MEALGWSVSTPDFQGVASLVAKRLSLSMVADPDLRSWASLADRVDYLSSCPPVTIALVGKYTGLSDAYLSVIKALKHAAAWARRRLVITWIDASGLEDRRDADQTTYEECWDTLRKADGAL